MEEGKYSMKEKCGSHRITYIIYNIIQQSKTNIENKEQEKAHVKISGKGKTIDNI